MAEPTQRFLIHAAASARELSGAGDRGDALPVTIVSDRVPVAAPPVAPVTIPGFDLLGELGRGGMGVVYKARQQNLNRLVALKVMHGGPLASEENKARFRIEAEAAARLHHPNIVQVYDVGECAGFSYMALELIEGETLRRWQGGRRIAPTEAAQLVATVARAIHHAHEQGIVHRDIKPANVLLAPVSVTHPDLGATGSATVPSLSATLLTPGPHADGTDGPRAVTPKITDFGLAKALDGGRDLTVTGVACGTPNYMAPEQVRGVGVGPRTDVYGLGAVLFELLAGRPPFAGADAADVMGLILKAEPPGVRKLAPGVPRDLAVIVAKCLEKDPAARYPSARDAADDLDRFLAHKPITARPVGAAERAWRGAKRNPVVTAFLFVSTIGCGLTGALAVELARTARDEHRARADAEAARDELRGALTETEAARAQADAARVLADAAGEGAKLEARRAGEKQQEADAARGRAEDNLRVARGVIRASLRELSRHPRFEDEDFRAARGALIEQARSFRDTVSRHAPNTPEWLDDLAEVSHWLGFLEYLNNNQVAAAAEYDRAAEAAGAWAALDPTRPEPRSRQSFSLVNAGNALVNARRFADAEARYRAAARLIDAVVGERPLEARYRSQSVEAHGQLCNVFRISDQPAAWEAAARRELVRAKALVRACGPAPDHLRLLGGAYLNLSKSLSRAGKPNDAELQLSTAVALRDELRTAYPTISRYASEYGSALLAHAALLNARGASERAWDAYRTAVEVLEKVQSAAPGVNAHGVDLAVALSQYADFLRARKEHAGAERRYNQALDLARSVLHRAPTHALAREACAGAATGRAHLYNATGRHREAAAEWAKLATDDPDPRRRTRHELFVMQSFLFARDWVAAGTLADAHMKRDQPGWMWLELARVWCLASKQIESDESLTPPERRAGAEQAVDKAVACLEKARVLGEFEKPDMRQWFASKVELAPVRDKFDPNKK
jgi:tetratricopeptide (TPR) repeat protein